MMKVCVMITTYKRPKSLDMLILKLKKLKPDCTIVVISDEPTYKFSMDNIDTLLLNPYNMGREGWWKTVNALWENALKTNSDYYIQMVDDSLPNDNFFEEAFRMWEDIKDPKKIALDLANNGREMNWTNFKRKSHNKDVYLTQTTEMSFLCLPQFITYKVPQIPLKRWEINPLSGSGVGPKLNHHWVRQGRHIYGVKKSLIMKNENSQGSLMNPEERKINPWKLQ